MANKTIVYSADPYYVLHDKGSGGGGAELPVWAAASSEYMVTGSGSHEFKAQLIGEGTPTFDTPAGLLLPDYQGVYVEIPENTMPVYGARWDNGVPYTDDEVGAPLTTMPSLYAAPAMTNLILDSSNITTLSWTPLGVAVVAYDQVGLTGEPNTASLLSVSGDGNANVTSPAKTVVPGTSTVRAFLKATAQNDWAYLNTTLFDTLEFQAFNLRTGQLGTISAPLAEINPVGGGWYECLMEFVTTTDLVGNVLVYTSTADGNFSADAGDATIIGNVELHSGKTIAQVRGSAPIVTAGASVTNTAITIIYDVANMDPNLGAYYIDYMQPYTGNTAINRVGILVSNADGQMFYRDGNAAIGTDGGVVNALNIGSVNASQWYKLGSAYSLTDGLVELNVDGTTKETGYTGYLEGANIHLSGGFNNGSTPANSIGFFSNIQRWDSADYTEAKAKITELMT